MQVVALLLTAVLGSRLLDKELAFLALQNGQNQGNFNPLLFGDADYKDYAMYNYLQNNQGSMSPWMLEKLDVDWPMYGMMSGQQPQQASKPGIRGQVSPTAQMNPAMMQAFMQSDFGQDLMDSDLAKAFFMAKMQGQQAQGQSRSPGFRGAAKGFGSYGGAFGGFGQPSSPTTPQYTPLYYPGMDEEMMEMQMMQQMQPGSFNPAMTDWDLKDWTRYNMMNQQSGGSAMNPMPFMDGDMGDYMMWQSFMNPQQQGKGPRGNAIEQMQKMALCQTYLNSMSGSQADQMQAYALYSQASDIGEDDIRDCMMMHQMQTAMAANQAPASGFDFGSGFGPRTLPDKKDLVMMAWMKNHPSGEGQGMTYYPGMDTEEMLEFNFWQKMKDQVATNQQ